MLSLWLQSIQKAFDWKNWKEESAWGTQARGREGEKGHQLSKYLLWNMFSLYEQVMNKTRQTKRHFWERLSDSMHWIFSEVQKQLLVPNSSLISWRGPGGEQIENQLSLHPEHTHTAYIYSRVENKFPLLCLWFYLQVCPMKTIIGDYFLCATLQGWFHK